MRFPYFPWRLFWKFFFTFLIFLNVLFLVVFGVAVSAENPVWFISCFLLLSAAGAAWLAYRFVAPLGRVIVKALRMASKKDAPQFEEDDVLVDELGEYRELEQALDKIRKKLTRRRLQLSHEREEIQTLMSSMEDAIISVDQNQKLVFFNSRFAAQFLTSGLIQSKIDGQAVSLAEAIREPAVLDLFQQALERAQTCTLQISLSTHVDRGPRFFSVRVSPLREEADRSVYGALAVFHDISELKKAEQIRLEFVENASHELRTPLTSVKGFVETLREDVAAGRLEQMPKFLAIISKNVDRLSELVNDMLTISTLESNSPLRLEMISPAALTEDVIARLSGLVMEKRILIKNHFAVPEIRADAHKLEQVLFNLIGNAIKYISDNGRIDITWTQTPEQEIRLTVKDNGPGIAPEHLGRLFERFYRVDKGRSRDVGGTGLGLSIVKHIMQGHGGSVTVHSELGQGAEFICLFPGHRPRT